MTLPPWLQPLADSARQRQEAGRLPHALLIAGPPGWGETVLASWLALTLIGHPQPATGDPSTLAHPDLRWLVPEGRQIKVDAVRELVTFCQGTPQSGPCKAAVLVDAHTLNRSSANALLKTLEEPPPGTHLLLATSHAGRLLPTIRSRCQSLVIRPDPDAARQWLEAHVEAAALPRYLFEHGGAPLGVREAAERGEAPLDVLLEQALDPQQGATVAAALLEAGLADALSRWSRYLIALAAGEWELRGLAGVSRRALFEFAGELTWARRVLLTSTSPNERLLAERLVARWQHLQRQAA